MNALNNLYTKAAGRIPRWYKKAEDIPTLSEARKQNAAKKERLSKPLSRSTASSATRSTAGGGVPTLAESRAANAAKRQAAGGVGGGGQFSMTSGSPETGWRHFSQLPGQTLPATTDYSPADVAAYEGQRGAAAAAREQAYQASRPSQEARYALFGGGRPQAAPQLAAAAPRPQPKPLKLSW